MHIRLSESVCVREMSTCALRPLLHAKTNRRMLVPRTNMARHIPHPVPALLANSPRQSVSHSQQWTSSPRKYRERDMQKAPQGHLERSQLIL